MKEFEDLAGAEIVFEFKENGISVFCFPDGLCKVRVEGMELMPPRPLDFVCEYLELEFF